jgi:hypothetical protein
MRLFLLSLGVGLLINSTLSIAFERSDGVTVRCEIERLGQQHIVEEIWLGHGEQGDRHPELGGAAAVVRPNEQGLPVIFFDSVVFKGMLEKDPHMSDFIFYHECAHAQDERRNEIEANCEAYLELDKLGMLNTERIEALAATHTKMRRLPSRYGGSGEVFWERTMACVNNRTENSAVR